jgi:hypothetical protein
MTTRPGYVWDDVNEEWVKIGQAAVIAPVSYQATEPTSPATGDIWIDSDDEVPGITSSLNYRWRRIATGGETSLSGNDSSGLPLAYNPGYEQVYLNGVLLYRGSDYVATTGNTITGLTALVANDTIEVLSFVTAPIGDTYTQAAADSKFVSKPGAILNTVQVVKSDTFSSLVVPNTDVSITGLSASITPSSSSSKVLVTVNMMIGGGLGGGTPGYVVSAKLKRNSTYVGVGNTAGSRSSVSASCFNDNLTTVSMMSFSFLDSPNTTSATSYSVDFRHSSGADQTLYLNRSSDDSDIHNRQRGISTITLQEVGA